MIRFRCGGSGSSGNCYSLTDESWKILLLDAGIPLPEIKKLVNWKVGDITGCFITHSHKDHSLSSEKLRKMGIIIYEPYKFHDDGIINRKYFLNTDDGWRLRSFDLPHDGVPCYGAYILCPDGHRMLYLTDFAYCRYTFTKMKVQTILIECNHMDCVAEEDNEGKIFHVYRGHSSLSTVCEFLRANQTEELKNVILCHLSAENADEGEMRNQVKKVVGNKVNVFIAKKGLEVEL